MGAHQSVDTLLDKKVYFCLEFVFVCKGYGSWGVHTEGAGILSEFYVEFFTRHYPYLAIKHAWELHHYLIPGDICIG